MNIEEKQNLIDMYINSKNLSEETKEFLIADLILNH